jgi:hypothetical protein
LPGDLAEVEVLERVGDVEAVDEVLVLRHGAATEARLPAATSPGQQQGHGGDIAEPGSSRLLAVRIVVDSTEATSMR